MRTADALTPPLAVDNRGNPIDVPEEEAAWRVRRRTGGRPKMVVGPDRQPLLLPLDTTADDLGDMLGPGSYRLDAVDEDGDVLDCVVGAGVGEAARERVAASGPSVATVPARGSDLRMVLEANVQMARSLADAVRVLSEAQADWTKGLASAKAIPRNAAPARLAAAVPVVASAEDAVDEDYEPTWYERLATSIPPQHLPAVISAVGGSGRPLQPGSRAAAKPAAAVRNAAAGGDQEDEDVQVVELEPFRTTPEVLSKIEAVKARLTPEELRVVTKVLATAGPRMLAEIARELMPLPIEEAVERVRTMMAGSNE